MGDHARLSWALGPDYVADIVNLLGRTAAQQGCDDPMPNWNNTVLLITWDDWGGWYYHISPSDPTYGLGIGYINNTGGQYVYGYRVPLLVVSAYAKQGYISGTKQTPIKHDFGSILKFIETTYGISGDIDPQYHYADYFVGQQGGPDTLLDFFTCLQTGCQQPFKQPIALQYSARCLAGSSPPYGCGATKCNSDGSACLCDVSCFINYPGPPQDPDDD